MPALEGYFHVYNRGVEHRLIFPLEEDYQVFLGFLQDYLDTPPDPQSAKKSFTVKGRTFQGVPHQPKNYFNKVELIAYSLESDTFHFILREKGSGSVASFIRSLATRYSMYYNKKYNRSGPLFAGPYKSIQIKDEPSLHLLTRYFHRAGGVSSYPEYLGVGVASWIKPQKRAGNYKNFVEKHELDQKERELLGRITFEGKGQPIPAAEPQKILKPQARIPEISVIFAIFLLLVGLGVKNIKISSAKNLAASPTFSPEVLSESAQPADSLAKPDPALQDKTMVVIKTRGGADFVNVRLEPTSQSEKIGEAKDGETFELLGVNSGWYEVKIKEGLTGFIKADYSYLQETIYQ